MKFYRYTYTEYAETGWDGELCLPRYPNPKIVLSVYKLVRETPKGYWITLDVPFPGTHKRWVSKTSKKRFAYPTTGEAINGLIHRTSKRVDILERQLEVARVALMRAKEVEEKLNLGTTV